MCAWWAGSWFIRGFYRYLNNHHNGYSISKNSLVGVKEPLAEIKNPFSVNYNVTSRARNAAPDIIYVIFSASSVSGERDGAISICARNRQELKKYATCDIFTLNPSVGRLPISRFG